MDRVDLSIIIVSYNTRDLTVACIRSVYVDAGAVGFEIICVDNASSDGSQESIAHEFPDVQLIQLDNNLGFACANNLAANQARGEYLLLLNPDTVVLDSAIGTLLAFARRHPEAGIFGGRTVFPDGSLNPGSCWGRPTVWSVFCQGVGLSALFRGSRLFDPESLGHWARDTVREVDIVGGCFFLIRRTLWKQLGGFDPAFFMYGEEADLCLRARKLGVRCLICPAAHIIHYGGASEKVRADKLVRLFRAKTQLFNRHWGHANAAHGKRALDLWALTRMTAFAMLRFTNPRYRKAYDTWRQVWGRRGEWWSLREGAELQTPCVDPSAAR